MKGVGRCATVMGLFCLAGWCGSVPRSGAAARLPAPWLLPDSTVAYVQVADVPDLVQRFQQTAYGRMARDEAVRPFAQQLYEGLREALSGAEEWLGVPLDSWLELFQGELFAALVAPPDGPPVPLLVADVGDNLSLARKLIERAEEALDDRGAARSSQNWRGTQLAVYTFPAEEGATARQVVFFVKDGAIGIAGGVQMAQSLLTWWDGQRAADDKLLAENKTFRTIMDRSQGTKDQSPQITWFVDPIGLAKASARDNLAAQAGLAMLPALGLDGLKGIGGSILLAAENYDQLVHVHLMLDNPRIGVLEMLALQPVDTTPQLWVPADVSSYMTLRWDIQASYRTLASLYDSFRGDDSFSRNVQERLTKSLGIDFEQEIIGQLEGRLTHLRWIQPPARLNSRVQLLAAKVKDPEAMRATLGRMADKLGEQMAPGHFGEVTYWQLQPRRRPPAAREEEKPPEEGADQEAVRPELRRPEPCVTVLDDYLIYSGSTKLLEQLIATKAGAARSLADEIDYKLIASKARRLAAGKPVAAVTFSRPSKTFQMYYDVLASEDTRRVLANWGDRNPVMGALRDALQADLLPPFTEISKYLAPGGGVVINDEQGLHYIGFSLKRQ